MTIHIPYDTIDKTTIRRRAMTAFVEKYFRTESGTALIKSIFSL